MSGYYPFGPHGPRSSPTQVTPNPTPAYVPPPMPAAPSYSNPVSYGGGGGGYSGASGGGNYAGGVGLGGPARRSYIIAFILAAIFGPFGLLYSNAKAAKLLLLFVAANVIWQVFNAPLAEIYRTGGFLSFIGGNQTLDALWSLVMFLSVVLSVVGVRASRKDETAK